MTKEELKLEKDIFAVFDTADEINPYATYLDKSTLSTVDEWIDTGSLALNAIMTGSVYKGVPKGRVVQFAGPSQTMKSFFVQNIIANAQKMGMYVIVCDSENAIEREAAKGFGIDTSKVKYIPCLTLENTRNTLFKILQNIEKDKRMFGKVLIVIDSLANMESELGEKRMGKDSTSSDMGTFAKAAKSLLKTCTNWGALTKTTTVITNHIYDDPAAMYPSLEKNMPGGRAAIYLPSITVQLARKAVESDGGKTIDDTKAASQKKFAGVQLKCLTVKNRFIKQFLEAELFLSYAKGLDKYYGLLEIAKGMGTIVQNGATYSDWEGNKLGYYKNFRKDVDLWENRLIPHMDSKLWDEWSYSNLKEGEEQVDPPDEEYDESEDDDISDIEVPDEDYVPYEDEDEE